MVVVTSGKTESGEPCEMYIDGLLKKSLDIAKERVIKRNWDYVCVISGIPGSGKSTFARTIARYCCPWFDLSYVAFTDDEFIEITSNAPDFSAVILDESFQSLNSKVIWTPEFLRIVNHIQIIRQKHLFIILCLPNFFDLSKGMAIFRASHLFVTYATEKGRRGRFLGFGRDAKRKLYIKGSKFMDYDCVRANITGKYTLNKNILSENLYEERKIQHLLEEQKKILRKKTKKTDRDELICKLRYEEGWKRKRLAEFVGLDETSISKIAPKSPRIP